MGVLTDEVRDFLDAQRGGRPGDRCRRRVALASPSSTTRGTVSGSWSRPCPSVGRLRTCSARLGLAFASAETSNRTRPRRSPARPRYSRRTSVLRPCRVMQSGSLPHRRPQALSAPDRRGAGGAIRSCCRSSSSASDPSAISLARRPSFPPRRPPPHAPPGVVSERILSSPMSRTERDGDRCAGWPDWLLSRPATAAPR